MRRLKTTFKGKISDGNIGRVYINVPKDKHEEVKDFKYIPLRITIIAEPIV